MRCPATKVLFVLMLVCCQIALAPLPMAQADTVTIGVNVPLSGPYAAQGKDQQLGYELAIETLNSRGGILGSTVNSVVKDTKSQADIATANTKTMIWEDNATIVSGGVTNAVNLAQSDMCQEQSIIFMAGLDHGLATTGHRVTKAGFIKQSAHRYTFRWFLNAWMSVQALAPYLLKEHGPQDYYYILSDDMWGRAIEDHMRRITELAGCDTLDSVKAEAGKGDYMDVLQKAKEAKPDVLVLVLFGTDMVKALKQAHELGLNKKTRIVVPFMELFLAQAVGQEALEGVLSSTTWYHSLESRFPGSKKFVKAFRDKYKRPPGVGAASAWVAVNEWAAACEAAGDVYADDEIILALEGRKFTLLKGQEQWRTWDHQAISSVFIVEGKSPEQSTRKWDVLEVKGEARGKSVVRSREENPVTLEPLVVEQ